MKKVVFSSAVAALFFALVQSVILSNIAMLPAIPDLVLLLVIYVSLKNGSSIGCMAGFLSGLIMDFASAAPLGLNAMTKTIAGFAVGKFHSSFNMQRFFIPIIAGLAATLLKALIALILSFFFANKVLHYGIASPVLWFEAAANAVCSPFLFMLLNAFKTLFIIEEREQISREQII